MHLIHLIIFRGFALLMDLSLLFLRMGLHAVYENERPEFAPKMLSKLPFIIANAASIILDRKKRPKMARTTQKTTPNHRDADSHRTNIIT